MRCFIQTVNIAEDVLRMIKSQPFDIVISDNQVIPPANQKSNDVNNLRHCVVVVFDGTNNAMRRAADVTSFFS